MNLLTCYIKLHDNLSSKNFIHVILTHRWNYDSQYLINNAYIKNLTNVSKHVGVLTQCANIEYLNMYLYKGPDDDLKQ
jgi:hypothetical protein